MERARQIFEVLLLLEDITGNRFQKFDVNKRGKILKEDFIRVCKGDRQITQSISALYTILPG